MEFYENPCGHLKSAILEEDATISNVLIPKNSKIELYKNGYLKQVLLATNMDINGMHFPKDSSIDFDEQGQPKAKVITEPLTCDQRLTIPKGSIVHTDDYGCFARAISPEDVEFNGLSFLKGTEFRNDGGIVYGDGRKIYIATLAKDADVQGVKCMAGKKIEFIVDGKGNNQIQACTLSEEQWFGNLELPKGTEISLDEHNVLTSAVLGENMEFDWDNINVPKGASVEFNLEKDVEDDKVYSLEIVSFPSDLDLHEIKITTPKDLRVVMTDDGRLEEIYMNDYRAADCDEAVCGFSQNQFGKAVSFIDVPKGSLITVEKGGKLSRIELSRCEKIQGTEYLSNEPVGFKDGVAFKDLPPPAPAKEEETRFDRTFGGEVGLEYQAVKNSFDAVRLSMGPSFTFFRFWTIVPKFHISPSVPFAPFEKKNGKFIERSEKTSEYKIETQTKPDEGIALGGTLDTKFLFYKRERSAALFTLDTSLGRIPGHYTTATLSGGLEFQLFDSKRDSPAAGVFIGGGTMCNLTDPECFALMQSGLKASF